MSVWKSDEKLLSICILDFSFKNDFVWEEISNIRHSVSSPDETPRSSSKILRCASYFQLSSRCFIWWWNTASHVWYITSHTIHLLFCLIGWRGGVWGVLLSRMLQCKSHFREKCCSQVCMFSSCLWEIVSISRQAWIHLCKRAQAMPEV